VQIYCLRPASKEGSAWDAIHLDGGGYAALGGQGVTDVSVRGSTLSGGASPGTTAQLILFSGVIVASDAISLTYTPPGMSPQTAATSAPAAEPVATLVTSLAAAISGSSATSPYLQAASVTLANPFYAMLAASTKTGPPSGQITNGSISVTTSGHSASYPLAVVFPGTGTYTANMVAGSGVTLVNQPHSIDLMANQGYGSGGAGIYVQSVTHLNVFANSFSNSLGTGNAYGIYFDPAASYSSVFVQGNDLTANGIGAVAGATPARRLPLRRPWRSCATIGDSVPLETSRRR
jgi:hypothetical protein